MCCQIVIPTVFSDILNSFVEFYQRIINCILPDSEYLIKPQLNMR